MVLHAEHLVERPSIVWMSRVNDDTLNPRHLYRPAVLAGVLMPFYEHAEMLGELLQGAILVPQLDLVDVLDFLVAVLVHAAGGAGDDLDR